MGVIIQHTDTAADYMVWEIGESLEDLTEMAKKLSYDFAILDTFKSIERRQQWLAVRLLCDKLSDGAIIEYKPNGQPQILSGNISISHSHNLVAVSVNKHCDTGIDIQYLDSKILRIQHKFLSQSEATWAENNLLNITIIWSVKEAMYKLYGDASPYFKEDYEVEKINDTYSCTMTYHGKVIKKNVHMNVHPNFVIALVND